MDIKIKKNDWNIGTIGWLSKGLESGEIKISEGTLKSNGNHGLWLTGPDGLRQYLASYNYYNISDAELRGSEAYTVGCGSSDGDSCRIGIWTDAAWEIVQDIAQQWCDECQKIRDNDQSPEIGVITIYRK